jgi:hypothetical protein
MRKLEAICILYPNIVNIRGTVAYDKDENIIEYDNNAVDALIASKAYKDLRATEYPAITDQLDYIYHNGIDAWKTDMIDPVKEKYPKGAV